MCAAHRGRLECAKALLRSGADPNFMNGSGDLVRSATTDRAMLEIQSAFRNNVRRAREELC